MYNLTQQKHEASSYDLDHCIPTNINRNNIKTKFELLSCKGTLEKKKKIISTLSNRKYIVILKQDKGRGVVIMDQNNYTEKCMSLLSSNQFLHIANDPAKSLESKLQWIFRKIKSKLPEQVYKKLYTTGCYLGKFYGTDKINKLSVNCGINNLPIRAIISNVNTATCNLAKYLSNLLSPLLQSGNTMKNKEFIEDLKQQKL